ncbi:YqzK family protein [Heyndrickxia ginsengihumi]|uniref:Membrane protein n=1 Tax=Heyndrickxia ginsengihumi TaxID=363870 RepID=A0A0A6VEY1_9BACI|nr:YqzK family protein [Heyndrickxia ginsengihumi]KHD86028.1 membrane protein [Heyndrickxia ginsengihumi]MBE6182914.1 DUF4227 family protein [Bacillus sp. (in: firmicutes)]MCM3022862.1 YqzK family protein [Heyndrickxia ginsengihumi]NEY20130.1 YqzK family protein [Heyndrickxia ginsengihumi]
MLWIKLTLKTLKIFILFSVCTVLFYYGILWVNEEYENYHRYDKPEGTAVKVSTQADKDPNWVHRLLLFYSDGE